MRELATTTALVFLGAACATQAAKIEHVIVLVMENRPFDHFFGMASAELPDADGLVGNESNPVDPSDPTQGTVSVASGNASYVCQSGPSQAFSVWCADFFGPGNTDCAGPTYPTEQPMDGWVYENEAEAMYPFYPEDIPVKMTLATSFGVMDRYYSSFPGPSTPNHNFIQMATSGGCTTTGASYHCNGSNFPQKTLYELMAENNKTWRYYYNDSAWNTFLDWFNTDEGKAGVVTYDEFYHSAETGDLPNFAFILPRQGANATTGDGSNDDHPCHDVALGEKLIKDTYEALRASPAWNETLFIITYDDAGGFYDHVPLVTDGVPRPDDEPSCPDNTTFTFLGPRLPTMLMSPWISPGTVVHDPSAPVGTPGKPQNTSKFEHSSIAATLTDIFGLKGAPLTRRDAWAASLLPTLDLPAPTNQGPLHLPDPPPKTLGVPAIHGCGDPEELTRRQRRRVAQFAASVDGLGEGDIEQLIQGELRSPGDAEDYVNRKFQEALRR